MCLASASSFAAARLLCARSSAAQADQTSSSLMAWSSAAMRASAVGKHELAADDEVGRRPSLRCPEGVFLSHTAAETKSCEETLSVVPQSQLERGLRLVRQG